MRFWDTSALFHLLTVQEGGNHIDDAFDIDPDIAMWWATPVELASAAARLRRMGEINDAGCARIMAEIGPIVQECEEIGPTEEVRQMAFRLVRVHDLSAADALQLAAALVWARHVSVGLGFVCRDIRLAAAAEKEGFTVLGLD